MDALRNGAMYSVKIMVILEVYWALTSSSNFTALLIYCSESISWLPCLILTDRYESAIITAPFYRGRNWGLAEGNGVARVTPMVSDSSTGTLTYWYYIASMRNRDTTGVGQLPRPKPRLVLPSFLATRGNSQACLAFVMLLVPVGEVRLCGF